MIEQEKKERKKQIKINFAIFILSLSKALAGVYSPQSMRNTHHCASTYKAALMNTKAAVNEINPMHVTLQVMNLGIGSYGS